MFNRRVGAAVLLVAAGCSVSSSDVDAGSSAEGALVCHRDSDCPPGKLCDHSGQCVFEHPSDAGSSDAGSSDGGLPDAGPVDAGLRVPQRDQFTQTHANKVDVLWVIDNSGSMGPKQALLLNSFDRFITPLNTAGVDFRLGVITTDAYDANHSGRLQNPAGLSAPWIGRDTCPSGSCDAVSQFAMLADVGTTGAGDEKGLLTAGLALTRPLATRSLVDGGNEGFARDDAALAIVVLSDEEDTSCAPIAASMEGCEEEAILDGGWGGTSHWVRQFAALKEGASNAAVSLHVLVATNDDEQIPMSATSGLPDGQHGCLVPGGSAAEPFAYAVYARRYLAVANAVTGPAGLHSICQASFGDELAKIAGDLTLQHLFPLSKAALPGYPIEMTVDGTAAVGCVYDEHRNAFACDPPPPAGAVIAVSYTTDQQGCVDDAQCPLESTCSSASVDSPQDCQAGCATDSDCALTEVCRDGACTVTIDGGQACQAAMVCGFRQNCTNDVCTTDTQQCSRGMPVCPTGTKAKQVGFLACDTCPTGSTVAVCGNMSSPIPGCSRPCTCSATRCLRLCSDPSDCAKGLDCSNLLGDEVCSPNQNGELCFAPPD